MLHPQAFWIALSASVVGNTTDLSESRSSDSVVSIDAVSAELTGSATRDSRNVWSITRRIRDHVSDNSSE